MRFFFFFFFLLHSLGCRLVGFECVITSLRYLSWKDHLNVYSLFPLLRFFYISILPFVCTASVFKFYSSMNINDDVLEFRESTLAFFVIQFFFSSFDFYIFSACVDDNYWKFGLTCAQETENFWVCVNRFVNLPCLSQFIIYFFKFTTKKKLCEQKRDQTNFGYSPPRPYWYRRGYEKSISSLCSLNYPDFLRQTIENPFITKISILIARPPSRKRIKLVRRVKL